MTYLEFQQRYFEAWWKRYFCPLVGDAADNPLRYTELCNSVRDRAYEKLSPQDQETFDRLKNESSTSLMVLSMFNHLTISPALNIGTLLDVPKDLDEFKTRVLAEITPHIEWHCHTFRELLELILSYLRDVEADFDTIFGGSIFEQRNSISGVTADGPPLEDDIYHR